MKIAILTHNISAFSQQRFIQAAKARNHELKFIHLSYCYTNIAGQNPDVYYRNNETFHDVDAIIPRISAKHTFYGTAILRQFERQGIYIMNNASGTACSHDKLRMLQHLSKKNLAMPNTGFTDAVEEAERLIALVGGAPVIVRLLESADGKDTIFAETHSAAVSVINAFKQLKIKILVQEYIQEAAGADIRCVVVGNKIVASLQRSVFETGFKSRARFLANCHPIKISQAEKNLVLEALAALKLNLATVAIIRADRGPLLLDIDSCPKIEVLEKIAKVDIADTVLAFIENHVKNRGATSTTEKQ